MKRLSILVLLCTFFSLACFGQTEVPQVAIIGTFHFGATNDMNALKPDDLSTKRRQQELDLFAEKLAAFKPTKIMVEWEPEHYERLNKEYLQYLNDEFEPGKSEVYQIAFRVAEKSGLKEIIPVDYKMDLGDAEMMEYLNKAGKMAEFGQLMEQVQAYLQAESEFLKNHTITDFYLRWNSDETDDFNRNMYLEVLPKLSSEPGNPLLNYTGNWYKRNIYIMGNIDRHLEPGDRVLVLMGSAHRAILKELYRNRDTVDFVEISDYLRK